MTSSGVSRQRWGSLLMRVSATGRSGTTPTDPESDDLHRLDQWADIWQIIFKPEKCYITNINKHTISHHQYTLKGTPLSTLSTWIYTSEWRLTHLAATLRKGEKQCHVDSWGHPTHVLHATPKSCKATAYQTLVKPKLEYASTAWSLQTPGKIRLLESVQNKAARFVCRDNTGTTSADHRLKMYPKWDSVESCRNTNDCVMWYKVHNHLVNMKFPTVVTQKPRIWRHNHQLAYLRISPRIDAYNYSYFVRTIPMWNGLPATTVAAPTLKAFQRLAMDHFRSQGQACLP